MSRLPSNRSGQSFIEFALIIILLAIVFLSILLILGDDLRTFINDLLQTWFPEQNGAYLPLQRVSEWVFASASKSSQAIADWLL